MTEGHPLEVTQILAAIHAGKATADDLLPVVYDELRRMAASHMRNERAGHTFQATDLVHEAFLKMVGAESSSWQSRRHFFGCAALAMERILVERARFRARLKRGGGMERVELLDFADLQVESPSLNEDELISLSESLARFQQIEPEKSELVRLRYFVGLSEEEAASVLQISRATASRWWAFSKAWLWAELRAKSDES